MRSRHVAFMPGITYFKPVGIPMKCLEEVRLSIDEIEAIRLKDREHMEQEQGAEEMNVSRPTFQRVLASAHQKIAEALLSGKAIRIEGGIFEMSPFVFRCANQHQWEVPFEEAVARPPRSCPVCHDTTIEQISPQGIICPSYDESSSCCRRCSRAEGPAARRKRPGAAHRRRAPKRVLAAVPF